MEGREFLNALRDLDKSRKRLLMKEADRMVARVRGWMEQIENMPQLVAGHVAASVIDRIGFLAEVLEKAESPIELILGVHLAELVESVLDRQPAGGWYIQLDVQVPIQVDNEQYRVDFLIWLQDNVPFGKVRNIVIECDGHEYHERTKEQAAYDKRRDRALQAAGYQVFRFTGSEIWNYPMTCVQEIKRVIEQIMESPSGDVGSEDPQQPEGPDV